MAKKVKNNAYAVALMMYYNIACIHKTLRLAFATAGVSDDLFRDRRLWKVGRGLGRARKQTGPLSKAKKMKIIKFFVSSAFGFIWLAVFFLSIPAFFYFEFFAAKHDHWIAFTLGLILPPVSAIGGALLWLGWIWQAPPSPEDLPYQQRELMQTSTTFGTLSTAATRCKWEEFSPKDIALADGVQNTLLTRLKNDFSFSDADIQTGRDAARKSGETIDCGNHNVREAMRRWMNGIEAMGANFNSELTQKPD